MPTVDTLFHGLRDVPAADLTTFVAPLLGFDNQREFALLQTESGPLCWMQSLTVKRTCFCVLDPSAAGCDPDGETGELHVPETHLIPLAIEAALDPARPLHVFGGDYPTPDGTAVRDYIHVSDLAAAHVLSLEWAGRQLSGGQGAEFNLGAGRGCSVNEVLEAVAAVSGRPPAVIRACRRQGDPAALVADASLAQKTLDWKPLRSDLGAIVSSAWNWRLAAGRARKAS